MITHAAIDSLQALVLLYFIGSSSSVPSASWPVYQDTKSPATPQGNAPVASDDVQQVTTPTTPNQQKLPPATIPGDRMNATFVTLARNSDVWEIAESIRQVEEIGRASCRERV